MKYNFCTLFDSNYLVRGLTLYRSLMKHIDSFVLYVVCLDRLTEDILRRLNMSDIIPISLCDIELSNPALLKAKSNRSPLEYYFTLSPIIPLYVFNHFGDVDLIAYLDADLYFYSHPQPIYKEMGRSSILIVEHRFPEQLKYKEQFGKFNLQYQVFRKNDTGLACLKQWSEQCIEWCYNRRENGKFADQKYLDDWPDRFDDLVMLQHKGAGLAPWNWMQYDIKTVEGQDKATVDGEDLIFYHFHGVKIINSHLIFHGLNYYGEVMPRKLKSWFYGYYIKHLRVTEKWIKEKLEDEVQPTYSQKRLNYSKIELVLSGIKNNQLMWV